MTCIDLKDKDMQVKTITNVRHMRKPKKVTLNTCYVMYIVVLSNSLEVGISKENRALLQKLNKEIRRSEYCQVLPPPPPLPNLLYTNVASK